MQAIAELSVLQISAICRWQGQEESSVKRSCCDQQAWCWRHTQPPILMATTFCVWAHIRIHVHKYTNASHLHPHLWFSFLLLFELCPNDEDVLQMNNVTAVGGLDLIIYF